MCTKIKYHFVFLVGILITFLLSSLSMAYSEEEKKEIDTKISGFRFYLTDKYGKQRGIINGFKADFISPNEIEIKEAKAQLTDVGKNPIILQTPYCVFIKNKAKVVTDKEVTIKTKGIKIIGKGMKWDLEKKILIIEKNVVVNIKRSQAKTLQEK